MLAVNAFCTFQFHWYCLSLTSHFLFQDVLLDALFSFCPSVRLGNTDLRKITLDASVFYKLRNLSTCISLPNICTGVRITFYRFNCVSDLKFFRKCGDFVGIQQQNLPLIPSCNCLRIFGKL
jgi:hypothetical protein